MAKDIIKVFVADDDKKLIELIVCQLKDLSRFEVVGTATRLEGILDKLKKASPDVLILDVIFNSPKTGLQVISEAKKENPQMKIIIITGYGEMEVKSLREGANGFLLKPLRDHELLTAVLTVVGGRLFYNMGAFEELQEAKQISAGEILEDHPNLSPDDCEYLKLKINGKADEDIAKLLNIKLETISQKRYRIAQRLGLETDIESFLLRKLSTRSNIKN